MQKRTLIIGGGVAGICLAHQLTQRNEAFNLVDDGKNVSSVVAAGIVHAMSFRRTLLSWNAMPFYKESEAFYQAVENTLNTKKLSSGNLSSNTNSSFHTGLNPFFSMTLVL